CMQILEFPWTF
nr:immunoglobulin light chain junction region [Macaca mulatta]MOY02239.1 immunoglobulin light chain junction region [Macaca mulatta]